MRTLQAGLALTLASALLAGAALWLREVRPAIRAADLAAGPPARPATSDPREGAEPGEPGSHRAPAVLALAEPPADARRPDPTSDFLWPLRDPPELDGPRLETFYAPDRPEFRGTQVLDADGRWVRDGPWTAWYENGQVCESGAYRMGREHGAWQWWYENGEPMARGSWIDGKRTGAWSFWRESGTLAMVGNYADGVGNGVWTLYHENGWKWAEGPWADGAPNGYWSVWSEDGVLDPERSGPYVDGKPVE